MKIVNKEGDADHADEKSEEGKRVGMAVASPIRTSVKRELGSRS